MRALSTAILAVLALGAAAAAQEPPRDRTGDVFGLIGERLALMKDVAAEKRAGGLPVEDSAREAVVLDAAVARAAALGLDPAGVRPFFVAQIEAAKGIQQCWLDRWEFVPEGAPPDPRDLVEVIRPELIRIGTALIEALAVALQDGERFDESPRPSFRDSVQTECLDGEHLDRLYETLGGVRLAPP